MTIQPQRSSAIEWPVASIQAVLPWSGSHRPCSWLAAPQVDSRDQNCKKPFRCLEIRISQVCLRRQQLVEIRSFVT